MTTPAGPPPTVTSFAPAVGTTAGGMQVNVTGTNFVTGTTALFGTTTGQLPTVVSPTQLTVTTPFTRSPGLVDVVVTNANGDAFLPNAFTYLSGPTQKILTITPTPGLIGIPRNTPVTVSFARPVDRATIASSTFSLTQGATPIAGTFTFEFGDTVVTLTPSATLAASTAYTLSLTQVPTGAATGPVTVTVNSLTSNGAAFTVTTPAGSPPTVTSFAPTVGTTSGGMQVNVTGTNFVTGTTALL